MSYITFATLGIAADLGSQIQQFASMYAIAKQTGKKIVFPESSINIGWGVKFKNILEVDVEVMPDSFFSDFINVTPKDGLLKDTNVFELDPNTNYNFNNLFHLYHYWYPKYKDDIFGLSWNQSYYNKAKELFESVKAPGKELVSIHVRRGDYLKHDHFCKLDTDYYGSAIQSFISEIEKYHFVVFSNDIEWCEQNLIEGDMVTFMDQGVDYVDMIMMSMCDHNIIANSSFSWWAAFKNKNEKKQVICPENYIRSYSTFSFINKNWYPSNWKAIQNDDK